MRWDENSWGIKPTTLNTPSTLRTEGSFIDIVNERANILHRFQLETMGVIKVVVVTLDYYDKSEKEISYEDRAIVYFMVEDKADEHYLAVLEAEGNMN